jgi:DNA primase
MSLHGKGTPVSSSVLAYLLAKKLNPRPNGKDWLCTCPFCDKPEHFSISMSRGHIFQCWKCGEKGNWRTLQRRLGQATDVLEVEESQDTSNVPQESPESLSSRAQTYHDFLHRIVASVPTALETLTSWRPVFRKVWEQRKFGWVTYSRDTTPPGFGRRPDRYANRLSIPYWENGEVVSIRYRQIPGLEREDEPKYLSERGARAHLYNADILRTRPGFVIVTEGEFDCEAVLAAGYPAVGVPGAQVFKKEWVSLFDAVSRVYLAYDADEGGEQGAKRVQKALGLEKTRVVLLPQGQDLTDYLMSLEVPR